MRRPSQFADHFSTASLHHDSAERFPRHCRSRILITAAKHALQIPSRQASFSSTRSILDVKYTASHEWIRLDGDTAFVGITDYAADALGDVVYVDLPEEDDDYEAGESFGSVESVKAASEVYLPVDGTITEANTELEDNPGLVNESPDEDGWFVQIKISDPGQLDGLLDKAAYDKLCAEEDH